MNGEKKILIVDDEDDILEFLKYNLEKEEFIVYTASNGLDALALAEKHVPDLIILDIMMPEMDGIEVCKTLRQIKSCEGVIIAFLTARNEDFTQIAGLDAGGDDFITKPIRPRVFISRVKALLRRTGRQEEDTILKFGDIEINKEEMSVKKAGEKIVLTKKEFELLYLLANKPGKVFNRERIFNQIWGSDVIVGFRTIDVHIRKLREKLGDQYIKTIKGIGYKIEF